MRIREIMRHDAQQVSRQRQRLSEGAAAIDAIHRTSETGAKAILQHGFDLQQFGMGAGAGSGEPAGVFVSTGDGADFARENLTRQLGLDVVLRLRLHLSSVLRWDDRDARIAYTKAARLGFLQARFGISDEDAIAVVRYTIRVMKQRPDLERIADWLDTREGERSLALFLNEELRQEGFDAVFYRESFRGVEQMIVLDPSKIEVVGVENEFQHDHLLDG